MLVVSKLDLAKIYVEYVVMANYTKHMKVNQSNKESQMITIYKKRILGVLWEMKVSKNGFWYELHTNSRLSQRFGDGLDWRKKLASAVANAVELDTLAS